MSKLSLWRTICLVCVFCALTVIGSAAQTFTTLVSFNGIDGKDPEWALVQGLNGNFYGTTDGGGASTACGVFGCGTVFEITPGGRLTRLHSFIGTDGIYSYGPSAGLVQATDGNLYGTTPEGGTSRVCPSGCGTVFEITPGGTLTTLHSFTGQDGHGYRPNGLVQATDGNFYGTTYGGGAHHAGTVFKITPGGTLTTLYSFCSQVTYDCADGATPTAGLVQAANGNFYGTTSIGGSGDCGYTGGPPPPGCGTVFELTPWGQLTTLYNFGGVPCGDGISSCGPSPNGLVQAANGNFYGTTAGGGDTGSICFGGCGTVFEITPGGQFTTLYNFCSQTNCTDGGVPLAGLVQATDGNFYGTTAGGGGASSCGVNGASGCGTAFEITPGGMLTTLHKFDGADGAYPSAELVQATNGSFYGTTSGGGAHNFDGTAYSLAVGLRPFVETLPTSGQVREAVIILGNNLTGATGVTFNGKAAKFKVVSSTEITTTVPSGATTGPVKVTTPSRTLISNVNFQVS